MRTFAISMCVVTLAACGGGGGGGVPIDDLGSELARVTCAKLSECCTTQEFMDATLGAEDESECRALFTAFGGILVKIYKDSIAAGRLVYHGDRMEDCFSAIEGQTCAEYAAVGDGDFASAGCEDPFEGTVAAGGQCATDEDCTSGWCSGDSVDFEGNITYGTCGAAPTQGMPCEEFDCGAGLYCEASTCTPKKADGMACFSDDECTSGGCNGDPGTCGVTMVCDGQ